jgi:hypothetical protein
MAMLNNQMVKCVKIRVNVVKVTEKLSDMKPMLTM